MFMIVLRICMVIEVLSPTTEKRDCGAKFKAYKALPSLQEYVLICGHYKATEAYRSEGAFWKQYSYQEGDTVELTSVEVRFSFERIYRGVRFHYTACHTCTFLSELPEAMRVPSGDQAAAHTTSEWPL